MTLAARRRAVVKIRPLLGWQRELLTWEMPDSADIAVTGALSPSPGTGKSWGAALRFAVQAMRSPVWDRRGTQPLALVVAPTGALLSANSIPILESLIPADAIVSRRKSPTETWTLFNGLKILFLSGKGLIDSVTARLLWVDEVSDPIFLEGYRWERLVGRLRGKGVRKELIVSGIAVDDPRIRERFDRPDDPCYKIVLPGLLSNSYLTADDIALRLRTASSEDREVYLHGGWRSRPDLVYGSFDWDGGNIVRGPIDYGRPVVLGLDVGDQASLIIGQKTQIRLLDGSVGEGLDIVGEVHLNNADSEASLIHLRDESSWTIGPESVVAIDTQATRDSVNAIRRAFPSLRIIQQPKRSKLWLVEPGVQRVNWAIEDSFGNRRLRVHEDLVRSAPKRGVVSLLRKYRRKDGRIVRPNDEHSIDALRYLVCATLEPEVPTRPARRATLSMG